MAEDDRTPLELRSLADATAQDRLPLAPAPALDEDYREFWRTFLGYCPPPPAANRAQSSPPAFGMRSW